MMQFYVSTEDDMRRCNASRDDRMAITISGTTSEGEIRAFAGVVQSVEDHGEHNLPWRWRVTMRESEAAS